MEFYNQDVSRRSVGHIGDACRYTNDDGNHCAVGRCMKQSSFKLAIENVSIRGLQTRFKHKGGVDFLLLKKYHGFNFMLWQRVQRLHDINANWDADGLTKDGVANYENIVECIKGEDFL